MSQPKSTVWGVVLGRFSPLHKGHERLIQSTIDHYGQSQTLILLGSTNVLDEARTPYTATDRRHMLESRFPGVKIEQLPDISFDPKNFTLTNDAWLDQISALESQLGATFEFCGGSEEDLQYLAERFSTQVLVPRTEIPLRARDVRAQLETSNQEELIGSSVASSIVDHVIGTYKPFIMHFSDHIFRAYDIRGVYGVDFSEGGFQRIGRAVVSLLAELIPDVKSPTVLLTGDGRTHTPVLLRHVYAGLRQMGAEVVFGGAVPTPIALHALHEGKYDASVQITASHNTAEYNGLKLSIQSGAVAGDHLQRLRALAHEAPYVLEENIELPPVTDIRAAYTETMSAESWAKDLTVVLDAGNGIAGGAYPQVLRHGGLQVEELYCEVDGTFPNHQPDPENPANMVDLQRVVAEVGAHYGLCFDGDGDRVGIVTRTGQILTADHILAVLALDLLSRHPGETVVLDSMCSLALAHIIEQAGGNVAWSPTGHSHIEHVMKDVGALLGGEQSGHFMFAENFFGHDDALLAAIRFFNAVQTHPEWEVLVTQQWPQLHEWSDKVLVDEADKFAHIERLQKHLLADFPDALTLDGVRINWPDGSWGIVRASNTTPKISFRVQAPDADTLASRAAVFQSAFEATKTT